MKLSQYLSDRYFVVRLAGKQIFDLKEFETLHKQGVRKVEFATAQGQKFQEIARADLEVDGDFDMRDRIAVRTQVGLLTVASVPGQSARSIQRSSMEASRPWPYRPGY